MCHFGICQKVSGISHVLMAFGFARYSNEKIPGRFAAKYCLAQRTENGWGGADRTAFSYWGGNLQVFSSLMEWEEEKGTGSRQIFKRSRARSVRRTLKVLLFLTTGTSSEFYSCHYQTRSRHVLHLLHPRQCSQD